MPMILWGNHDHGDCLNDVLSVLGLNTGYTVKYTPLPSGVPLGLALGNSFRQRVYLTLYPSSCPNTATVLYNVVQQHRVQCILFKNTLFSCFSCIIPIENGNLVGEGRVGNLRWDYTELYVLFTLGGPIHNSCRALG